MRNYIQPGDTLDLTAPAGGIVSGQAHLFGDIFGIASTDAAEGRKVAVKVEGVFKLPKASGGGLAEGQKVYWIAADKRATGTASGNTLVGHAVETVAAGATEVAVRLAN
jgi:predicted RecA/RadA family phage recombinase